MITLALNNDTWDLYVDEIGNIATKEGQYQIVQDVASSQRVWKGEYLYDTTRGIPYKHEIFGNPANASLIQEFFNTEAKRINDVISTEVTITDYENRVLSPDTLIKTTNGTINA